ncbi:MAG: hypothetical protein ACHQHO_12945 [Solirubrobacterales bacterium]
MAETPEELALELSRELFASQQHAEAKLRERATTVLSAASVVVPIAAVALHEGPKGSALPFGLAAAAYLWCAIECCRALFPRGFKTGIRGGDFLELARLGDADVRQMQASAAGYLDQFHADNLPTLEATADRVRHAIFGLIVEIAGAAVALVVTLLYWHVQLLAGTDSGSAQSDAFAAARDCDRGRDPFAETPLVS